MSDNLKNSSIGRVASNLEDSQHSVVEVISDYGDSIFNRTTGQREGFLQKFFPEANQRAMAMAELKLIETEFEFRRKAVEMARESQIQGLRETCNQYLVKAKGAARMETQTYLMKKAQDLLEEIEQIYNKFGDSVLRRTEQIEKAPHPLLQQKLARDLEKDINDFFVRKEALTEKFNHIISEGV